MSRLTRWLSGTTKDTTAGSDKRPARPFDRFRQAFSSGSTSKTGINSPSPSLGAVNTSSNAEEGDPFGIKVLVPRPGGHQGFVDIVAIHGLNGDRENTWTDRTTGLNWLSNEDCLPNEIPHARVLTFGYNATTYFSRTDSDVRDFASELLIGLQTNRRTRFERERPIVFICHSLGGLVFKQAVIRAHERHVFYGDILRNIRGVVFFATPHRGSDLAFWNRIGTSLLQISTLGYSGNPTLSKDLMVNAEMLRQISDSFVCRGGDFNIRSFYETHLMPGLNCRVVERDSSLIGLSNELDIASPAHHSNICKFSSSQDTRYKTAISVVADLVPAFENDEENDRVFTSLEQACMRQLVSSYEDHLGQVDDPVEGTCTWLPSQTAWLRWEKTNTSALLLILADAGCGKSVMAKFIVNHLEARLGGTQKWYICYFFFKEGLDDQNNATAAISALLHQLCLKKRNLVNYVLRKHTTLPAKTFNRFSTLSSTLLDIIQDLKRDIFWVVDGLDECESKSLRDLARWLNTDLKTNPSQRCHLKIIFLSRPHPILKKAFRLGKDIDAENSTAAQQDQLTTLTLEVSEEGQYVLNDITLFIKSKLRELEQQNVLSPKVLPRLEKKLIRGADYTFLWISLVVQLVEDAGIGGISAKELESIFNTTKLDDLYERLLAGRPQPRRTTRVLLMILAAVRPLTLKEMCGALEVYQDDNLPNHEHIIQKRQNSSARSLPSPMTPIERRISNLSELDRALHKPFSNHLGRLCGHFIRIRAKRVYLVHQTARRFLLVKRMAWGGFFEDEEEKSSRNQPRLTISTPVAWKHSLHLDEARFYLLQTCSDYLQLFRDTGPSQDDSWTGRHISKYLSECAEDDGRAFFNYAAVHWVDHYRPLRLEENYSFDHLLRPSNHLFNKWIFVHRDWVPVVEREKLETGGLPIPGPTNNDPQKDENGKPLASRPYFYSAADASEPGDKAFQEVLEFFDLERSEATAVFDQGLRSGSQYWKADDQPDEEGEETDWEAHPRTRKLPDKILYYRNRHRRTYFETLEDMSSPLSPRAANPTSMVTFGEEQPSGGWGGLVPYR